jgi:hypothetical protein
MRHGTEPTFPASRLRRCRDVLRNWLNVLSVAVSGRTSTRALAGLATGPRKRVCLTGG